MLNAYNIGISTMSTAQRALDLVGQNISNSATPGYHRQGITLAQTTTGDNNGTGVKVQNIFRYTDNSVRSSLVNATSDQSRSTTQLNTQRQAESLFSTGTGSIDGGMQSFFNALDTLSTQPSDATQKRVTVSSAVNLSNQFNQLTTDLGNLKNSQLTGAKEAVDAINTLAPKIADLNKQISVAEATGGTANDLRDQRDSAINDLSQYIDVRLSTQDNGVVNVMGANDAIVVGNMSTKFEAALDTNGSLVFREAGSTTSLTPTSGKLAGYLQDYNQTLPGYQSRLDQLANKLITNVNAVQATGLTSAGPSANLAGTVSVANPTAPLSTQNLSSPIQAGQLMISVTQQSTGTRTLVPVNIDPATQSLQDVANAITSATGGQVQGSIDPTANSLNLQAQSGYAFDFAGRVPTPPNAVAMNGTSAPTVTGTYTGSSNDTYSFQVVGNGTVGTTPGLSLEVRDSANNLVSTLNVGDGYEAGSPLTVGNGLTVRLGAGTTNAGSFSVPVTANADTAGVLPALGVGGLFRGSGAGNISVNSEFTADPSKLATSRSGDPGETSNIIRMAGIQDKQLLAGGTQTLSQYYGDTIGQVGVNVSTLNDLQTTQANMVSNLSAQEQSTSGVDLNEEMVNLLTYQRMVEAGSRYLSVVNTSMDAVFAMIN